MNVTSTVTERNAVTSRKVVDVEYLLDWTYRRQKADIIVDRGMGLNKIEAAAAGIERHAVSGDWASIDKYGHLGCFIDQMGFDSGQVPPDAETVHETVAGFGEPVRSLLMQHARTGTRPECALRADFRYEPVWKSRPRYDYNGLPTQGSYKMIRDHNERAVACAVRPRQHISHIEAQRRHYRLWHNGLVALATHFVRHPLTRFVVTGPATPASPWQ